MSEAMTLPPVRNAAEWLLDDPVPTDVDDIRCAVFLINRSAEKLGYEVILQRKKKTPGRPRKHANASERRKFARARRKERRRAAAQLDQAAEILSTQRALAHFVPTTT